MVSTGRRFARLLGCGVVVSCLFLSALVWNYFEVMFPRTYEGNLVVGVIAAKESSYIEEWLAHHFYYGVDKIVIFDNNDVKDVQEKAKMRSICQSFGERCEIIDFNMYDGVACMLTNSYLCGKWLMPPEGGSRFGVFAPTRRQGMAKKEFYYYKDNYKKYRWVMMFDVDEFLVTKNVHAKIPDVLRGLPEFVHGVHVPRFTFGTDNHTTRPAGSVRLNYCWREKWVKNSKGMARSSQVWLPGLTNHIYFTRSMLSYEGLTEVPKFITIDNRKSDPKCELLRLPNGIQGVMKFNHLYIDPGSLVLNHYLTKSMEEHLERRSRASLNYKYKLKDVYTDDKTRLGIYNRLECPKQNLTKLPPLMTMDDLKRAEELDKRRSHQKHNSSSTSVSRRFRYLR